MIPRRRYEWPPGFAALVASSARAGRLLDGTAPETICAELGGGLQALENDDVLLTGSGRAAMVAGLKALGVDAGSEVIVPSYTFAGVPEALAAAGFVPVAADVDDTGGLSIANVESVLSERSRAVIVTHLFGRAASLDVVEWARHRGMAVLEDCAHAAGSSVDGRQVGFAGDAAFFSFDALKPIAALGGGLVIIRNGGGERRVLAGRASAAELATRALKGIAETAVFSPQLVRWLRIVEATQQRQGVSRWADQRRRSVPPGTWSHLQSRLVARQLATLSSRIERRRGMARRLLAAAELVDPQLEADARTRANAYFLVVRADDRPERDAIVATFRAAGIDVGWGTAVADVVADLPGARRLFDTAVQVPVGARYSDAETERIVAVMSRLRGRISVFGLGHACASDHRRP